MPKITLNTLDKLKSNGEKISMLTVYDASFAKLLDECALEIVFVGDSLGNVIQGHDSTLPVTVDDIAYHTHCVKQGNQNALLMADLPFMSYASVESAIENATTLMQAGAEIVKLEGGAWLSETIETLTIRGIPVCAHLGLTPQSVHQLGGYKVQGRATDQAEKIKQDALQLERAGARMLVLECVPCSLAKEITSMLSIPTIGIGAGPDCDGQVLVLYDMLGLSDRRPKFTRTFLSSDAPSLSDAVKAYVTAVKDTTFPSPKEMFE